MGSIIAKINSSNSLIIYSIEKMCEYKYVSEISIIKPNLYLSGIRAIDPQTIKQLKIRNIINITETDEDPEVKKLLNTYLQIKVPDIPTTNLFPYFQETTEFIDNALKRNEGVLVHCQMGVSRSATLIIAYLMKKENLLKDAAFKIVSINRPIINPNAGFIKNLVDWENLLLNQKRYG